MSNKCYNVSKYIGFFQDKYIAHLLSHNVTYLTYINRNIYIYINRHIYIYITYIYIYNIYIYIYIYIYIHHSIFIAKLSLTVVSLKGRIKCWISLLFQLFTIYKGALPRSWLDHVDRFSIISGPLDDPLVAEYRMGLTARAISFNIGLRSLHEALPPTLTTWINCNVYVL